MRSRLLSFAVVSLAGALFALLSLSPGAGASGGNTAGDGTNSYNVGLQQGFQAGAAGEAGAATNQVAGTSPALSSSSSSKGGCS